MVFEKGEVEHLWFDIPKIGLIVSLLNLLLKPFSWTRGIMLCGCFGTKILGKMDQAMVLGILVVLFVFPACFLHNDSSKQT